MARKKRRITEKDLLRLRLVRSLSVSPDEDRVAYTVEWTDEKDKKYYSNLWVVGLSDGQARQFTFGKFSDSQPCWSPDGKRIAFVSTRRKKQGIYVIPADGGEARKIIEEDGVFRSLSWSPDGRKLLCSFRKNDPKPGDDSKGSKGTAPVVREVNRLFYRLDGMGFLPKDHFHVYTFDVETSERRQLTKGKYDELHPCYSPDGRKIAFVSNRSRDPDRDSLLQDLFMISSDGGREKKIPTPRGPVESPSWSPDGKKIAYLGHKNPEDAWGVTNYHVWVASVTGKLRARDIMPKFDHQAVDLTINDTAEDFPMPGPEWSRDGRTIYFIATDRGSTNLYSASSSGGRIRKLLEGKHVVSAYSAAGRKTVLAFLMATPLSPGDLYVIPLRGGVREPRRLTRENSKLLGEIKLSRPREVHFKSGDGTRIQGWVLKPPFARPGKKYPGIVEIHGGPRVQYGNVFFHELQFLAARGYAVFYCNPRGSQGYGEKHAAAIVCDWGNRDYDDIMAGARYFSRLPFVNGNRMGVTGGSYGGYMTNWIVGHTDFFKAAVTQRSVTNLVSFFGSSDMGYDDWREFGGNPWDNFEDYVRMSPITYVKNIKTPLLIIHSESDLRCSIEQAEQLFAALKVLRRKVMFLRFPEEPHGLSRMGRPDRRIERLRRIVGWFDKYL